MGNTNNTLLSQLSTRDGEIFLKQLLHIASVIDSLDDAILSTDLDGIILSWNRGAEKMFGYEASEIIGQSVLHLAPEEYHDEIIGCIIPRISRGDKIYNYETIRKTRDDRRLYVANTACPLTNREGQIIGVSVIMRYLTHNKVSERELMRLERLNLLGEMAATISHEIRNPLAAVRGFLQILSEKPELRAHLDHFELMIQEMDRANSIITEFLSIGRNRSSEKALINLNQIIRTILPLIESDALRQDKTIRTELQPIPDQMLDQDEIRQLIYNLVRNGLDAMERSKILTLRTYLRNKQVVLEIEDQGSGIDPRILAKIGTPFQTTKKNGTGLGLSVCYSIARRHQATIDIKTGKDGTTFSISFNDPNSLRNLKNSISKTAR